MSEIFFHTAGRLGNQLFQAAFGHQLSLHFDKKVIFFVDKFHHINDYPWNVSRQMGECSHFEYLEKNNLRGFILKVSDALFTRNKKVFDKFNHSLNIMRSMNAFDSFEMPENQPNLVSGFFINSSSVEKTPIFLEELNTHLARKIDISRFNVERNYEVVHVRGADFKDSIYGALGKGYYEQIPSSNLPRYIITDDLKYAESVTRKMNAIKIFSPEEVNPWEALNLMRNSSIVFASNSTLAWWGGYLCLKNGGQVIFPRPFYKKNFLATESLHVEGFKYLDSTFNWKIND